MKTWFEFRHHKSKCFLESKLAEALIALLFCILFVASCSGNNQFALEEAEKTPTIVITSTLQPKNVDPTTTSSPTTKVNLSPITIASSSPTPFPMSTPLPSLVWTNAITIVTQIDTIDSDSIQWSPTTNDFIAHDCFHALKNDLEQQAIYHVTAPTFSLKNITPSEYELNCFLLPNMLWSIDGTQIIYSNPIPEDHPLNEVNDYGDMSTIWTIDINGENKYPINLEGTSRRYLALTGWLDAQTLVFTGYGRTVTIFDIVQRKRISWAELHIGGRYQPGIDYVGSNVGMNSNGNISAVAISKTKVREENRYEGGPYIICVTQYCHGNPPNKPTLLNDNSLFEDWLPNTNKMLLLTWEEDKYLPTNRDPLAPGAISLNETQLQLWDVDAHEVSMLISSGINGRFSNDGQFLAYLTVSFQEEEPSSMLNLLHLPSMEVKLSVRSAPPNIDYGSAPNLSWSPDNDHILYLDNQNNWKVLQISKNKVTTITHEGGIRLSDPKWSADGKYFSMELWGGSVVVFQLLPLRY